MTTRYSTALSHIVLAGTSIYCYLVARANTFVFAKCIFGTIIAHSVIGIWRWGNPTYGPHSDRVYVFMSLLQDYLVLPCIVSSVLLQYGYMSEIAYAFVILSFLVYDTMVAFNCLTLGTLSLIYQNYFGIAASVSYAFTHFVIRNDYETNLNVTSQDLYNYAMCFFAFFSLKTVLD